MNLFLPKVTAAAIPKRDRITQTMVDDFVCDPVFALYAITGARLDTFQAARLRHYWWTPDIIDSSGLSTLKTGCGFYFCILRAVVLGNQEIGVFYQSFDAGKAIFWPWFKRTLARPEARLLRAHIGIINEEGEAKGKSERKSGSMWSVTFKSDSVIKMPAPNWYKDAENAAGLRLNVLYLDEWTKSMNTGTKGLEEQLMGRTSRECWNQRHPVWRNHRLLSGTAESRAHPAYALVKKYERAIAGGDPNTGHISYSFKDYSDREVSPGRSFRELYRDEPLMEKMQNEWTESHLMEEGFGIWSVLGRGVYSPEALARCVERGKEFGTEVGLAA